MLPLFIGRPLRPFRALRTAKLRPIGRGFVRIHIARQRPVYQRSEAAKKLLLFFSQPRLCPSARTPFSLMVFLSKPSFFRSRASSDLCRFASRTWPFHRTIQSFEKIGVQKKDCVDITLRNLLESGSVLFSRAVSSQVLSALRGLTSVFGMGTGGSLSPLPPEILFSFLSSSFPENCTDPFPLRFPCSRFRLTYGFRFLTFRFFHTLLLASSFP